MTINIENKKFVENLENLINESQISLLELSKLTGVPQSTIYSFVYNNSPDPKLSALCAISNFFGLNVSQLIGQLPLNHNIHNIPLLSWDSIDPNTGNIKNEFGRNTKYLSVDIRSENPLFALNVDTEISYIYKDKTIIIVEVTDKFKNGDVVLISNAKTKPVLKKVIMDGSECYLEAFNAAIPVQKYAKEVTNIIGIVRETRIIR